MSHNSVSYTDATVTVDDEILRNTLHSNVDIERPTDANGTVALKEYATSWKDTVIHFDSHDDMKILEASSGTVRHSRKWSVRRPMERAKTNDQQWNRTKSDSFDVRTT